MRILVLAIVATCWALSWSQTTTNAPGVIDDIAKKCLAQEKLTLPYLTDFINGKIKAADASTNLKCFVRCHMEARGYIKNGQLMEASVVKDAPNITSIDMMKKIVATCNITKGNNVCETSFNIFMCISDELP